MCIVANEITLIVNLEEETIDKFRDYVLHRFVRIPVIRSLNIAATSILQMIFSQILSEEQKILIINVCEIYLFNEFALTVFPRFVNED